ncbi:MAG TPA: hypothetical protein VF103_16455, partial [Polyangiaceae bacterium]
SKFETPADCKVFYAGVDEVTLEQTKNFYSCLGACRTSPDADLERLMPDCAASAFGHSGPWGELCARTCSALSAAGCSALPDESACLEACAGRVIGDCSDDLTALDRCGPTVECRVDGTPTSPNCADELANGVSCLGPVRPSDPTPPDFYERLSGAFCDGLAGCCTAAGLTYDGAACRTTPAYMLGVSLLPPGYQVAWDGAAGEQCIAAYAAMATACAPTQEALDAASTACALAKLYRPTLAAGEPCKDSVECLPIDGVPALCTNVGPSLEDSRCAPNPHPFPTRHGVLGDPCSASCTGNAPSSCSGGPAPAGGIDTACYVSEGFSCDFVTQRCIALAALGESCTDRGCGGQTYCDGGVCAAKKPDGAACGAYEACEHGRCSEGVCVLPTLASPMLCSATAG